MFSLFTFFLTVFTFISFVSVLFTIIWQRGKLGGLQIFKLHDFYQIYTVLLEKQVIRNVTFQWAM